MHYTKQVELTEGAEMLHIYPVQFIKTVFFQRDSTVHLLFHILQCKLQHMKTAINKHRLILLVYRSTQTGNSKLYRSRNCWKNLLKYWNLLLFLSKVICHNNCQTSLSSQLERKLLDRTSALHKSGTNLFKQFSKRKGFSNQHPESC